MSLKTNTNVSRGDKHKLPCIKCSGRTEHVVMVSVDQDGEEDQGGWTYQWNDKFQIVQCCGCKVISYRSEHINSEDYAQVSEDDMDSQVYENLYPSRVEGRKSLEEFSHYFSSKLLRIYKETLLALNNESAVLAGIGLRALVETICKDNNAQGSNLYKQIDALVEQSVLTPSGAKILHKIRTLGNEAAHEVKPHNSKQLGLAMDVVEHVLREVYILPKQVHAEFGE
ncbi:DUF4145 domain-containing protein [Vibrio cholerae]|uniref:DUF4145 domain-containing protein n=1 Tax=Vibrio cholerae TaxID=666 RepID=UPI001E11396C|nr:DUF4145 domain-containing protein [Vibrio cholerae]EGR4210816.1 DUF4145 domain-containing protein [Vibrio cholerae]EKF9854027.1 DUF4145 domain-containing protein [Vibrio cholerae]ELN6894441.1 DUF4145 domain-containing protein [Vibrio cholerae]MCX9501223.1 DUF4145 domain-containing protein [Vibrio cholerae]MCX9557154.1 DUF4145 domain-containing protein [Vibrio cholerae]